MKIKVKRNIRHALKVTRVAIDLYYNLSVFIYKKERVSDRLCTCED